MTRKLKLDYTVDAEVREIIRGRKPEILVRKAYKLVPRQKSANPAEGEIVFRNLRFETRTPYKDRGCNLL